MAATLARGDDDFSKETLKSLYKRIHIAVDVQCHNVHAIQARQASIVRGMHDGSIDNSLNEIVERCRYMLSVTSHIQLFLKRKLVKYFGRDCLSELESSTVGAVDAAEVDYTTKKWIALPNKSARGVGFITDLHGNSSTLGNTQNDGCSLDDGQLANGSDNAGGFFSTSVKNANGNGSESGRSVGESALVPKALFSTQQKSAGPENSYPTEQNAEEGGTDPESDRDGSRIMSHTPSTPRTPSDGVGRDADLDAGHSDPKSPINSLNSSDERPTADNVDSGDDDSTDGNGSGTKPRTRSRTQNANGEKRKWVVYDKEQPARSLGMAKKHRSQKKAQKAPQQATKNNSVAPAPATIPPPSDDGFFEKEMQKVTQISQDFAKHGTVVAKISLNELVLRRLNAAFNATKPNVSQMQQIASDLAIMIQVIEQYRKKIAMFEKKKANNAGSSVVDYQLTTTIGDYLSRNDKAAKKAKVDATKLSADATDVLSGLNNAIRRYCGLNEDLGQAVSDKDILKMSALIATTRSTRHVSVNAFHLFITSFVLTTISMDKLLGGLDNGSLEQAEDLWKKVLPEDHFDADEVTMHEYQTKVLKLGLSKASLRNASALVATNMKSNLSDTRAKGQLGRINSVFTDAQSTTLEGRKGTSQENYCGGDGNHHRNKRRSMACLAFNLCLARNVEERLPVNFFKHGMFHTLLLHSPSFNIDKCNFWKEDGNFFGSDHDVDSAVAKSIASGMKEKYFDGKEVIVVDCEEHIQCLRRLVGEDGSELTSSS